MPKKKKYSRKKKQVKKESPQHNLPDGFWSQVWALVLMAVAILFVVAWFNAGGPVLEWLYDVAVKTIGYAVYIVPMIFAYISIGIFKAEDNKLPLTVKVAAFLAIVWFAALFGLLKGDSAELTGGFVGNLINTGVLKMVNVGIATFLYILLIIITLLYVMSISPATAIKALWSIIRPNPSEDDANAKVMKNAAALDGSSVGSSLAIKAAVPTVNAGKEPNSGRGFRKNTSANLDKPVDDKPALVTVSDPNWKFPSLDLLEKNQSPADPGNVQLNAKIIQDTLSDFDIEVKMEGANIGPRVTQFQLLPAKGVRLDKITALEKNLASALEADSLRIEAPIPGQKFVGIEMPNKKGADVRLHAILNSKQWKKSVEPLTFAIGRDISGDVILGDLSDMPHLLIAGQTKAGKSVMINALLMSLLYHNSPSDMKLILIDPKRVEMTAYEDIPHLLTPTITEPEKVISALKWCVQEMERRYALLSENKVKTIQDYNADIKSRGSKIAIQDENGNQQEHEDGAMPYIVIVIDELSDLKQAAPKDFESLVIRLAQKGRAAGLHLVVATQSPRKDVITGLIKANIPAKIAFAVSNQMESRIIIDQNGAEKLLGRGDMLLSTTDSSRMRRVQGAWVSNKEVHDVMDYLRMQSPPQYNDQVVSQPVHLNGKGGVVMDFDSGSNDALYQEAVSLVVNSGKASASALQRHLSVGYARAARLIDTMEEQGVVGPANGARPREVLVDSMDEYGITDEPDL